MKINMSQPSSVKFGSGVYYTEDSNIGFVKNIKTMAKDGVKFSEEGYKYHEAKLPQEIKDRFENNELIKNLSEKYDTFIWFEDLECGNRNFVISKIMWNPTEENFPQAFPVVGYSEVSREDAIDKMFEAIG